MEFSDYRAEFLFNRDKNEDFGITKYLHCLMESQQANQVFRLYSSSKILFLHDLWYFIHYGKEYKLFLSEKTVALKKIRLALLRFLASVEGLESAKALSEQERFLFCYCFLMELEKEVTQNMKEKNRLQQVQMMYEKMDMYELQQKMMDGVYEDRLRYSYLLAKTFKDTLFEVPQIKRAILDVYRIDIARPEASLPHFIQCLVKADDLLEISFWKQRFEEQGLKTLFETKEAAFSPTIVLCTEQTDRMRMYANVQLGLLCAISVISEQEARDFVYIPYSNTIGQEVYCAKGRITNEDYLHITQQFLGGEERLNYRDLLNVAFTMLKLGITSSRGEIILVCSEDVNEERAGDVVWQQAVERFKNEMNIRIIVIYLGEQPLNTSIWFADQTISVEEFQQRQEAM